MDAEDQTQMESEAGAPLTELSPHPHGDVFSLWVQQTLSFQLGLTPACTRLWIHSQLVI